MRTDEIILAADTGGQPVLRMFRSSAIAGQREYTAHHHTQLEITAVTSGSCEWQVRRRSPFVTGRGDIVIFGSDEEHYITSVDASEPLSLLNLQFEPRYIWSPGNAQFDASYLSIFLSHDSSFDNRICAESETARSVLELMQGIFAEGKERRPEYALIVKAELLLLLGMLGRQYHGMLTGSGAAAQDGRLHRLDDTMSYINSHLCDALTLEDISRQAQMSRSYFSTFFKRMNGISVWDYITGKRIELAMKYLSETDLSVIDISGRCGFNNIANFNRSFRMLTHMSPREYRQSLEQLW